MRGKKREEKKERKEGKKERLIGHELWGCPASVVCLAPIDQCLHVVFASTNPEALPSLVQRDAALNLLYALPLPLIRRNYPHNPPCAALSGAAHDAGYANTGAVVIVQ